MIAGLVLRGMALVCMGVSSWLVIVRDNQSSLHFLCLAIFFQLLAVEQSK